MSDIPGIYHAHYVDAGNGISPAKGTPFVWAKFNVTHRAEGSGWVDAPLGERTIKFWLADKTMDSTIKQLKDLGWNGSVKEPELLLSEGLQLECRTDRNNPQYTEWILPYKGSNITPMDDTAARALERKIAALSGGALTPPPLAPTTPASTENIPATLRTGVNMPRPITAQDDEVPLNEPADETDDVPWDTTP